MTSTTGPAGTAPRAVVACPFCATLNRIDLTKLAKGPRCAHCHRPILLDRPVAATASSFDPTLRGTEVPVLVDFHADWCQPCHMLAPTLDEFARRHSGRALVLKLDTDAHPGIASRHGIRGLPTVIAFQQARERGRQVGVVDLAALEALAGVGA